MQFPVVKNPNDVINLRKLYDKIEISVRNLDSLDVKKETYGNLLISIINARLPEELHLYLSRNFKNSLWNIDDLLTFLKTDVEAKERLISNSNYVNRLTAIKTINQRTLMGDLLLRNLCLIVAITINHVITQNRGVHFVI